MAEFVAGENAEGVPNLIVEAAAGKIELDVPGFLLRAILVEQAPGQECRGRRIVAGPAKLSDRSRRSCSRRRGYAWRRRRGLVQIFIQRLQHPGGFLAAGNAEIQTAFRLGRDRFGIIMAIIAALAAILL